MATKKKAVRKQAVPVRRKPRQNSEQKYLELLLGMPAPPPSNNISAGAPEADPSQANMVSPIFDALSRIEARVEANSNLIDSLRVRLSPVRRPIKMEVATSSSGGTCAAASEYGAVFDRLCCIDQELLRQAHEVADLYDSLSI